MSVLVGVLIAAILAGVISVSLMQLIPFTQDEAAKHSLRAVTVAQSTARITNGGAYLTLAELESRDLLRNTGGKELKISSDGRTFTACIRSDSGAAYEIDSARSEPRRTATGQCSVDTPVEPPVEASEPWILEDSKLRIAIETWAGKGAGALTLADAAALTNADAGVVPMSGVTTYAGLEASGVTEIGALNGANLVDTRGLGSVKKAASVSFYRSVIAKLDGLDALESVAGRVEIAKNAELTEISGLNSLTTVGGYFQIWDNPQLTAAGSFDSLTAVEGIFEITRNAVLTEISGLNSLATVGGYFQIYANAVLAKIQAFSALESTGSFELSSNPALTRVTGFQSFTNAGTWKLVAIGATSYASLIAFKVAAV